MQLAVTASATDTDSPGASASPGVSARSSIGFDAFTVQLRPPVLVAVVAVGVAVNPEAVGTVTFTEPRVWVLDVLFFSVRVTGVVAPRPTEVGASVTL